MPVKSMEHSVSQGGDPTKQAEGPDQEGLGMMRHVKAWYTQMQPNCTRSFDNVTALSCTDPGMEAVGEGAPREESQECSL